MRMWEIPSHYIITPTFMHSLGCSFDSCNIHLNPWVATPCWDLGGFQ
ncbi:hypothetical protein I7I50_04443 [Histoplasma capsulatum G186AR]|uniref:Uncharacterized protein n=1 Tax=Ajellomyces capsulatus TaxID=5037 RepID=A0A8H8CZ01_AJECA|nr:hypothetical protein I7I52_05351 [Histoplasma capsulatum]QSS75335.1 hypothetical protein I7I50_04443 [Histoplasma capsulatum G186AR]